MSEFPQNALFSLKLAIIACPYSKPPLPERLIDYPQPPLV